MTLYLSLQILITFVNGEGCGCPARASLTVVSQMCGSWSPRAVTMNWTGSDRLPTSCSAYTVPSGRTLKLGSLLTKPTSLLRWQSSNFTAEERQKRCRISKQHSEIYSKKKCLPILDTSGRLKINRHPSRRILKYPSCCHFWFPALTSSAKQTAYLLLNWNTWGRGEPNSSSYSFSKLRNVKIAFPSASTGGNGRMRSRYIKLTRLSEMLTWSKAL